MLDQSCTESHAVICYEHRSFAANKPYQCQTLHGKTNCATLARTTAAALGEQGSSVRYKAACGTTLVSSQVAPKEQMTETPNKVRL